MNITEIQTTQPNRNAYRKVAIASAAGAAAGAGARYIMPTRDELSSMFNKKAFDTFASSVSANARGAKRSILKYGAAGAIIAAGLSLISKAFSKNKTQDPSDYSKMGALIDAPDYAVEIMWYKDKD